MDISNLQQYYSSAFYSLRRNGLKNKILLIALSIPAILYAYYDINGRYKLYKWEFPHIYLYYLCAAMLAIMIFFIVTINTLSFVNSQRVRSLNSHFKKQLFECIKQQIPEINGYCNYKKIHPRYFHESGLYNSAHTDYIGDDLFQGDYKSCRFAICELHVFRLFKQVFNGLFVRITINSNITPGVIAGIDSVIQSFDYLYDIKARVTNNGMVFIAIKLRGKLFEQGNLKEIRELKNEIEVLSDMVKIIKGVVEYTYGNVAVCNKSIK